MSHGWQQSEQAGVTRERWRSLLRRKEAAKHHTYDAPCRAVGWAFMAMAFGTWGGLGPECAKLLARVLKRASGWQEGDLRAVRQDELRQSVGLALMRQIWRLLGAKNFILR